MPWKTYTWWRWTASRTQSRSATYCNSCYRCPRRPETEWIVRRLPLERRGLSALRFSGINLSNVSFRSSNLEAATFDGCSLSSAVLADAALKGTSFKECEGIGTADLGDLSTFFSATVNGETF